MPRSSKRQASSGQGPRNSIGRPTSYSTGTPLRCRGQRVGPVNVNRTLECKQAGLSNSIGDSAVVLDRDTGGAASRCSSYRAIHTHACPLYRQATSFAQSPIVACTVDHSTPQKKCGQSFSDLGAHRRTVPPPPRRTTRSRYLHSDLRATPFRSALPTRSPPFVQPEHSSNPRPLGWRGDSAVGRSAAR